jgi:hypothetical protein
MKYASKVTPVEKEAMGKFMKPKDAAKPMHPKEKISEKSNRVLPIRGMKF